MIEESKTVTQEKQQETDGLEEEMALLDWDTWMEMEKGGEANDTNGKKEEENDVDEAKGRKEAQKKRKEGCGKGGDPSDDGNSEVDLAHLMRELSVYDVEVQGTFNPKTFSSPADKEIKQVLHSDEKSDLEAEAGYGGRGGRKARTRGKSYRRSLAGRMEIAANRKEQYSYAQKLRSVYLLALESQKMLASVMVRAIAELGAPEWGTEYV
jgi:hypothetical protein